jgi:type II secretory pathway pseudopilin PulG
MRKCKRTTTRRGFWLVESAIAISVIGIGMVAVVGSQQAWHIQAVASEELATGMRLATEIREMSLLLPANDPITGSAVWGAEMGEIIPVDIDDLDDLDDVIFAEADGTGPIDATGTIIVGMSDWEQQITVQCVDPFDVTTVVPDGSSEVVRIEVTVLHNGEETTRLTWIAPR